MQTPTNWPSDIFTRSSRDKQGVSTAGTVEPTSVSAKIKKDKKFKKDKKKSKKKSSKDDSSNIINLNIDYAAVGRSVRSCT